MLCGLLQRIKPMYNLCFPRPSENQNIYVFAPVWATDFFSQKSNSPVYNCHFETFFIWKQTSGNSDVSWNSHKQCRQLLWFCPKSVIYEFTIWQNSSSNMAIRRLLGSRLNIWRWITTWICKINGISIEIIW